MKKILSVILTLVMLFSITAFASADESLVDVLFWHAMSGSAGEMMESLVEEYNTTVGPQHGYHVTSVFAGAYADSAVKMNAIIANGNQADLPDLYQISAPGSFEVVNNEYLIPIYTLLDNGAAPLEGITPQSISYSSYQGKLYFYPISNSSVLMFYNKTIMNELGITEYPKTMSELAEFTAKTMIISEDKVERFGFATQMRTYLLGSFIPMQGEGLYMVNEENGHANTPTAMAMDQDGTLAHLLDAWQEVLATGGAVYNDIKCQNNLTTGLYVSVAASSGNLASLTASMAEAGYELGVSELVRVDENCTNGSGLGGSSLALYNSGRPGAVEGAYDFIQFLHQPEICAKWVAGTGYMPANTEAWNAPALVELTNSNPNFVVLREMQEHSKDCTNYTEIWSPSYNEINTIITNECIAFGDGQSKEATIERMADQVNELITDWWDQN